MIVSRIWCNPVLRAVARTIAVTSTEVYVIAVNSGINAVGSRIASLIKHTQRPIKDSKKALKNNQLIIDWEKE